MKQISFLIKPASSLCNLRCRYCFYADEAANRSQQSMGLMTEATVQTLLRESFACIEPGGQINFMFQGGEPTVAGLPFFEDFVHRARVQCPPRVQLNFSLQTNGTLLNEDWARFLKNEGFLVGLSIDGFKDLHNAHRVDAEGGATWNRVTRALALLQKHKVAVNALCVVTAQCARSPEKVYNELKKLGFTYIQFIACLDPVGQRGQQPFSLTPKAYGQFLCRVFDLWYKDWEQGHYRSVRLFDDYIHILLGDNASTCATCGRCGAYFTVEGDGSVYPCDFFCMDEWKMGRLGENTLPQLAESEAARRFTQQGQQKPDECAACRWKAVCNGGCQNDWYTDGAGLRHNYHCEALRALLDHAMPRMIAIARAEQAARRRAGL